MSESDAPSDRHGDPLAPLNRDICCRKDMLWATNLERDIGVEALSSALERRGFTLAQGASPITGLYIFDHRDTGHRVIYVARTGRIQIRLDPLTGHDDRTRTAAELYELLRLASQDAVEIDAETRATDTARGA